MIDPPSTIRPARLDLVARIRAIRNVHSVVLSLNKVLQDPLSRVRSSAPTWATSSIVVLRDRDDEVLVVLRDRDDEILLALERRAN